MGPVSGAAQNWILVLHLFGVLMWIGTLVPALHMLVVHASHGEDSDGFLHAFAYGSDLRDVTGCQQGNDDAGGTAGSLLSFLLYTVNLAATVGGIAGLFAQLMQAVGSSQKVFMAMSCYFFIFSFFIAIFCYLHTFCEN